MARVVTCPSCQAKGAIPDGAQVARIRCPKCGTVHRVGDAPASAASSPPPVAEASGARPRRGPAASAAPPPPARGGATMAAGANHRVMMFALLGVSGLAVVLLGAVLVLLMSGGRPQGGPAPAPAENATVASAPAAPTIAPAVSGTELAPAAPTNPAGVVPTSATKVAVNAFSSGNADHSVVGTPAAFLGDRNTPPDPKELLRRLKDATVLINTKIGKKTVGNGSGFVIEVDGDRAVIATNRHVAVMDLSEAPPGLVPSGTKPTLDAVFRSGTGKDEQVLPAQIIAADMSGDMSMDLAFLVVKGVKNPPIPIDPFARFEPYEGMGYVGAGFPLGGILSQVAESKGHPSVTITRGGVSALRRDDFGQLSVLQVDGSLQPGNSGGPIVDSTTGKLLGVAVAKVTAVDTIGFVVPADHVRQALGGRVGGLSLTLEKAEQGRADLTVKANLVDPKMQVAGVEVRAVALSKGGKPTPNSDGSWPALANSQPVELQRNPRQPSATGRLQVSLSGSGNEGRKILVQSGHRDLRGRMVYSRPKEVFLPENPGPIRDNGSMRKIATQVMVKSLGLLGSLVDPDKDCRLEKDEKSLSVRIDVPGKLHTISLAYMRTRNTPYHNAPMSLADVDGDFMAQVDVTGDINPGDKLPRDRAAQGLPFTFQSAGLVFYQDRNNFMRVERVGSIATARLTPIHRILVEAVRDGQKAIEPIYFDVPEGDVKLVLIRRKGRLKCLFVPSGSGQVLSSREFALNVPAKAKVGLIASNISAQPFSAHFRGFALISDATQIDRELDDE